MANTVQISYTGAEINRRLAQVMKNVSDLSENFEKDREFRENFANSSYVTSSVLSDYALKSELPEVPSIDGLISKEDADSKYALKSEIPEVPSIEGLISKEDADAKYALKSEIPEVPSIEGLASENYVNTKITEAIDNVVGGASSAFDTLEEIASYIAGHEGTGSIVEILGTKANKSELDNYALKSDIEPLAVKSAVDNAIDSAVANLTVAINDKLDASYLPTLATKEDIEPLALKSEIQTVPTNVSAFENDANYLTAHQSLEGYATEQYVDNKISDLIAGADENFDTLNELAYALTNEDTGLGKVNNALNDKANVVDVYNKTAADDKFVDKAKYDELNNKYTTLFNVVYSNATDETATELNADYVANNLSDTNASVEITKGKLGNVTIPEVTKTMTVTAPMQDGSTVTLSSPKAINLNNTSENPVAVTIDAPAGTSIPNMNVSGDYTTLTVNNGSITGKNNATVTNVIINNDIDKNASVTGVVYNDNATITSTNLPKLGLANNNTESEGNVIPSATINAENTTVTLNKSQWNELTSNVSDNTLIVTQHAHINTLNVVKGNVIVYDNDIKNRIGEVVNNTEYTVDLNRNTATTAAEVGTLLTGNPGIVTLSDDFTRSRIAGGILWSGNYTLDLAGHTLDLTNTNYAIMGRNTVNITIKDSVGGGKLINNSGYGLWAGDNSTFTIDGKENTEIIGVTHTLYCEGSKKPHINVIGGTYKMIIEDSATDVYDANGNYKFMLNHYDSTYTREGNCFTITGGTFYGFDPSRMYGDPYTNPVTGEHYYSMIDTDSYESQVVGTFVDSRGTTMNIYKVVKK